VEHTFLGQFLNLSLTILNSINNLTAKQNCQLKAVHSYSISSTEKQYKERVSRHPNPVKDITVSRSNECFSVHRTTTTTTIMSYFFV
jgi:hypothetical protein